MPTEDSSLVILLNLCHIIKMLNWLIYCLFHSFRVDHVDNIRYMPWVNFDPRTWTISKIVFYIIPRWGGTHGLVGGNLC